MNLPVSFTDSLEDLPGLDSESLLKSLETEPPVSIRFNPYKISEKPVGDPVPWSRYGFYLDRRPVFTLDPAFHAGVYYVQEASSMFLEHIYCALYGEDERLKILDLCAAPGGKTTLLSTMAGLESLVVSNEVVRNRAFVLAGNVAKWGLGNVVVTSNDPSHFEGFRHYFDLIVADVPCSGEGMFRKNPESVAEWSPDGVNLCAQRQKRIISDIWETLKPGGHLVYSTCTFNRQENEENIRWIMENYNAEGIEIEVPGEWNIVQSEIISGDGEHVNTFRFYPGVVRGEGFFTAVLRKKDGKVKPRTPKPKREGLELADRKTAANLSRWVSQPEYMAFGRAADNYYGYYSTVLAEAKLLSATMSVIHSGVKMGQLFGGKLKPDHSLALFHDLRTEDLNLAELDTQQALHYLRKDDTDVSLYREGLNLITWNSLPLGWVKRIGNRSNNLYPKEFRISHL